jgi:NADH dehydrogenase (ubiquinone) 1 alpha subcomplex subunit 10
LFNSPYTELLVYDWSKHGDVEVVVEDIERIDFDNYRTEDTKLEDWRILENEWDWNIVRHRYAHRRLWLENYFNLPIYNAPELLIDGDDTWQYRNVLNNVRNFITIQVLF